ncbi:uncharacterized protein BKCO1_37000152 [Diplodia corticola]|uniref:Cupin type-2 domain-containing protein n=1 Tax=Diplodia corticola TaxID=236234 RepID=A0A1J9RJ25_9PEZI|nr:uncharacterized protein BKCO1_37000152 [Diplodia corticola]OJD32563.1 hypothetical protein BKCO1_37000152 [Diplodia corticola]
MSESPQKPVFLPSGPVLQNQPSSFAEPTRGTTTWHTLLSAPNTPTDSLTTGIATCPPNGSLALHRHKQAEIYYILSGTGEVEIEGERQRVVKDTVVWIPGDAEHGVFCGEQSELQWLYVFPESKMENVVYRFRDESEYNRPTHRGVASKL